VESVIRAAQRCGVQRVLFTSSDKAVNPTSVMGVSKLLGERLFSIAGGQRNDGGAGTVFCSVRFGNVAGSRGSVIPIFCGQIARGENLTLTDSAMSRFFMSTDRAIDMLIFAIEHAQGGEVFITKMKALMVERLAYVLRDMVVPAFARDANVIAIQTIGARAGEKLYEELLSEEEVHRTEQLPDYYVVLPPTASGDAYRKAEWNAYATGRATQPVSSAREPMMDDAMIRDLLRSPGTLAQDIQLLLGIKPLPTGTLPGLRI
jgi:FlaA1/EpsC-like NDP-sugar epimerase